MSKTIISVTSKAIGKCRSECRSPPAGGNAKSLDQRVEPLDVGDLDADRVQHLQQVLARLLLAAFDGLGKRRLHAAALLAQFPRPRIERGGLAERFAHAPTEALGLAKSVMNRAFESDRDTVYAQEAAAQAMCRESAFHQEAVRRFLAKEAPQYQWPESKK